MVGDQRDTYIQISISIAVGLLAFLSFCVCGSPLVSSYLLTDIQIDTETTMAHDVCCAQEVAFGRRLVTGPLEQSLRMDAGHMEDQRCASAPFGGT